ncbi:uncharacterized protein LOC144355904 [Saccoglossus kowalevskii]
MEISRYNDIEVRMEYIMAATVIQKWYRGYDVRKRRRVKWIADQIKSAYIDFDSCRSFRALNDPAKLWRQKDDERKREIAWRKQIKKQITDEKTLDDTARKARRRLSTCELLPIQSQ